MTVEAEAEAQLPLDNAGMRLVRAREAAGKSRAQIAAETRIPERHLAAIEEGNYTALPARTYAVGFSRSYAKAVGADEAEIVAAVRDDLADNMPEPVLRGVPAFEPGDPARVPSAGLAWMAALLAVVVVIAGLFFGWKSYFAPGGSLPSILAEETAAPVPTQAAAPAPVPAPSGLVVFTALQDRIWVRFSDAAGNQLLQKELALGESYTVPAEAADVRLWTARPEALAITIGGQVVPKLSEVQVMMKDVPVAAAALLARPAPGAAPVASQPAVVPSATRPPVQVRTRPAVRPGPAPTGPSAATLPLQPAASPTPETTPANQPADR